MTSFDRSVDFPREVTDAIKEAFVVEESEDEDEVEIDLEDFILDLNAGLGTVYDAGLGIPTGNTVRVRHLYFNFQRFWMTLKTLADAVLKVATIRQRMPGKDVEWLYGGLSCGDF